VQIVGDKGMLWEERDFDFVIIFPKNIFATLKADTPGLNRSADKRSTIERRACRMPTMVKMCL
jgi:hypothetical protein